MLLPLPAEYVAGMADVIAGATLFVLYCVGVVLCFVINQGYCDPFAGQERSVTVSAQ